MTFRGHFGAASAGLGCINYQGLVRFNRRFSYRLLPLWNADARIKCLHVFGLLLLAHFFVLLIQGLAREVVLGKWRIGTAIIIEDL
jgi:hypothetical protein